MRKTGVYRRIHEELSMWLTPSLQKEAVWRGAHMLFIAKSTDWSEFRGLPRRVNGGCKADENG